MSPAGAYILATVTVLLILVGAAYGWYNQPSKWVEFKYTGGSSPAFGTQGMPISRLRFRDCQFTTANPDGVAASWDVSAVLNSMAAAYDIPSLNQWELKLYGGSSGGLNPFSFKRKGFNTTDVVPTAAASQKWTTVPPASTTLTGKMRYV
jgi:hypothetical protein